MDEVFPGFSALAQKVYAAEYSEYIWMLLFMGLEWEYCL